MVVGDTWLDGARTVSAIARALTEACIDPDRLARTLVEQIAAAVGACCALHASDGRVRAGQACAAAELVIDLRGPSGSVGALHVGRAAGEPALSARDRELVELVAAHAGLVLALSDSRAALRAEHAAEVAGGLERFARLDRSGILGVLIADLTGRLLDVNDALATLVGYTRAELLAPDFDWATVNANAHELDERARVELRAAGSAQLREKQYTRKDGSRVWVMIGTAVIERDTERVVQFVLDITARKQMQLDDEARQRAATEHAEAVRAQLAAIVESSADAIIGKTLDGVITSWNAGARAIFGYTAAEMIGQPVAALIPPGREHEELELLEHLRRGEVTHLETVRRRSDGRDIAVAVTSSPIFDAEGRVCGASKVARDITERRAAELALARAKDEAERASRELETFSYSVAHDLRAPLRGIDGFAKILLADHGDRLDADGRDSLDEICASARQMSELIDALLSLSRVTRSELRRERTDLAALGRTVMATLAAGEPERRVDLAIPPHLDAEVDPRLARALLDNLLGNAWKFTRGVAHARIELGVVAGPAGEPPVIFVRDNGAGFDMAHAANLFAPFQRMHTVREFAGTGIGLATVQRIVHRHGGRIWADAAVNRGAAFSFTLGGAAEAP